MIALDVYSSSSESSSRRCTDAAARGRRAARAAPRRARLALASSIAPVLRGGLFGVAFLYCTGGYCTYIYIHQTYQW